MDDETVVWVPVDERDLFKIQEVLREEDVFVTTFGDLGDAVYDAVTYIKQRMVHRTTAYLLLDRNIQTRIVALPGRRDLDPGHRLAAAVLSFAQTIDALIEPCMALHELASSQGRAQAVAELPVFRRLDNTHPQIFANVALGRETLDPGDVADAPAIDSDHDFDRRLWRWDAHYVAVLKLAVLLLSDGSPLQKMSAYLDWMGEQFLFLAAPLSLAARYLSPNGRKKRAFKALKSADRAKALKGVRNATWDMAIVSEWSHRVHEQERTRRLWLLVSNDKNLRDVARDLFASEQVENLSEAFRARLCDLWGPKNGLELHRKYEAWQASRRLSGGPRRLSPERASRMVEELESALEEWRP